MHHPVRRQPRYLSLDRVGHRDEYEQTVTLQADAELGLEVKDAFILGGRLNDKPSRMFELETGEVRREGERDVVDFRVRMLPDQNPQRLSETLIVVTEGSRGISKTFDQRYQLTDFGLGFVRLALETNTPIVPVAVIGGEEQYPSIADFKPLARLLRMPAFPVMPQIFFGMIAPLPTKYRLYFGEPLQFSGDADDDDAVIEEKVWLVKSTIQSMVNRGLRERKGVFL